MWRPRDSCMDPSPSRTWPCMVAQAHPGSSRSLGPQDPLQGQRVSVRLWGGFWVLEGWSSFAEKSVGKGNPRETC